LASVFEGLERYARSEIGSDESMMWRPPQTALVDRRYKYIYEHRTGAERLYDLQQDPEERRNLAGEQPETVRAMREQLSTLPTPR
jgi:arylsulfatase A-like enzyme